MDLASKKSRFIEKLSRSAPVTDRERLSIDCHFEDAFDLAVTAKHAMPGIGFCSPTLRMNAFLAVCRHLDAARTDRGGEEAAQLALLILRLEHKPFLKAITMFEIRAPRFGLRERADMPHTAREYLVSVQ